LIARGYLDPEAFADAAREATALADRLADVELRSWAWGARDFAAYARGDYDEGLAWTRRRLEVVAEMTDPDHIAWIYENWGMASVISGRFDEARRAVRAHDEVTVTLTPHHRLHTAALLVRIATRQGRWNDVQALKPRAEQAVAANIATPCVHNVSVLLDCAIAHTYLGDDEEARRLERSADDLGMQGYMIMLEPSRIALALARGELREVKDRLGAWEPRGLVDVPGLIARLNALVALDRRAEIEEEAPALVKPRTYLEPFALRALGFARSDAGLVDQAIERFEAMGLDWHAAETRKHSVAA
jgi:tetratricopeptide (TPR) repeat protein